MKYLVIPVFKFIFSIILTILLIFLYFLYNFVILIWDFKLEKWSECYNNHHRFYRDPDEDRQDNNPLDTFKRLYNLDLY